MLMVPRSLPVKKTSAVAELGTVAGDQLAAVFQSEPGPTQVWPRAEPLPTSTETIAMSLTARKPTTGVICASRERSGCRATTWRATRIRRRNQLAIVGTVRFADCGRG